MSTAPASRRCSPRCCAEKPIERVLVFTRTKHGADRVVRALAKAGLAAEAIHGNKSQGQRERVLAAFRAGKVRTLVATDIAARGIDVDGISHVINYDLPNIPESYVHRIGRTARAGADGIAISFCDARGARLPARHREADPHVDPGRRAGAATGAPRPRRASITPTAARPAAATAQTAMHNGQHRAADRAQAHTNAAIRHAARTRRPRPRMAARSARSPSCSPAPRPASSGAQPASARPANCDGSETNMAKEELLEFDGTVTEVLPDGNYRVKLDNEQRCWPTCPARCASSASAPASATG